VLANTRVFEAMQQLSPNYGDGVCLPVLSCLSMPIGLLRRSNTADFQSVIFRRALNESCEKRSARNRGNGSGCFDRLLRSDENLRNKWIYVMDNPVRQGLVQKAQDWPYYLDFINDEKGKHL